MSRFDKQLLELIPHRPPMLLINRVVELDRNHSVADVDIDGQAPFYVRDKGVPAWIGIEYMGQTAALIAGYQQKHGFTGPHLGFLLGTRRYTAQTEWFAPGCTLRVACSEIAVVGDSLANFHCVISPANGEGIILAEARLSVFRKQAESV